MTWNCESFQLKKFKTNWSYKGSWNDHNWFEWKDLWGWVSQILKHSEWKVKLYLSLTLGVWSVSFKSKNWSKSVSISFSFDRIHPTTKKCFLFEQKITSLQQRPWRHHRAYELRRCPRRRRCQRRTRSCWPWPRPLRRTSSRDDCCRSGRTWNIEERWSAGPVNSFKNNDPWSDEIVLVPMWQT